MADNVSVRLGTAGGTANVAADEVTVYGGVALVQGVKIHDGAEGGTVGAKVSSAGELVVHQANSGTVSVSSMPTTTVQATDLDVRDLEAATDSVAAVQSGAWNVGGTVSTAGTVLTHRTNNGTVSVSNTVTVQATNLDVRDLTSVSDSVAAAQSGDWNVGGTVNVAGTVPVSGTVAVTGGGGDGAILDGASSSIKATVFDYTAANPLAVRLTDTDGNYVSPSGPSVAGTVAVSGGTVNVAGTALVHVTNAGTVVATNLDIRDLSSGQDSVAAVQSGSWNVGVSGTALVHQVNNGTVSVSNTVTVDGSGVTQPVSHAALAELAGAIDGTEVQVDVVTMPTVTVQATNLDVRDLTSASDSVAAAQSGAWNIGGTIGVGTAVVGLGYQLGGTAITLTASGTVVPAVAAKILYVTHEAFTVQGGTVTITARNGNGGGTLWGPMQFSPTGGMAVSAPIESGGLYQTASGSAVYYELAGSGTVGGRIRWAQS